MQQVVAWLGECKGLSEVARLVQLEFGKKVSPVAIHHIKYGAKNREKIQKMRDEYAHDLFLVDIANKRRRLERIEKIVDKCEAAKNYKTALEGMNQVRQEIEKDLSSLSMTNYNINVYKNMTEAEIEEERIKSIERIKVLRGELACRVGERKELENQGESNAS